MRAQSRLFVVSWVLLILLICLWHVTVESDQVGGVSPTEISDVGGSKSRTGGERRKKKGRRKQSPERLALQRWSETLSDKDYDVSEWRKSFRSSSAADFFNGYARKLSTIFQESNAKLNFAMVGACDGTGDNTIKHLYLPQKHWRGVFVEPMSINVADLITYMASHDAAHRSHIIRAAATDHCVNSTLFVERPLYEEKNASLPHWLRRQIGSVLPTNRNHARKEWTLEEVRCVTAKDILDDWTRKTSNAASLGDSANNPNNINNANNAEDSKAREQHLRSVESTRRTRRPHVLKIDVEGHDYAVLTSFLRHDAEVDTLPLLIEFEAKSVGKQYPLAKERMELLGYVVSPFGQDGFALLRADKIREGFVHADQYYPRDSETD